MRLPAVCWCLNYQCRTRPPLSAMHERLDNKVDVLLLESFFSWNCEWIILQQESETIYQIILRSILLQYSKNRSCLISKDNWFWEMNVIDFPAANTLVCLRRFSWLKSKIPKTFRYLLKFPKDLIRGSSSSRQTFKSFLENSSYWSYQALLFIFNPFSINYIFQYSLHYTLITSNFF